VDPLVPDHGESLAQGGDEEQHAVALRRLRHAERLEMTRGRGFRIRDRLL
jgi:hypothetical protein